MSATGVAADPTAPHPERVVIVGNGHAAVELAAALRQRGFAGSVTLVGDEPDLPYQRPPLSKELYREGKAAMPLRAESFYAANRIDLRLSTRAIRIDRAGRQVLLDDGTALPYDHLVLATGARNRVPPVPGLDACGLLELRTLAHARVLSARLAGLRHVIIVGGGFIGLEVGALLRARGTEVTLIEAADRVMGRVVSPVMSAYFRDFHERAGIGLRFGTTVASAEPRGGGARVTLSDGSAIDTDAIVMAIGVIPNVELAAESGLATRNGIVVDQHLLTSDPAISAIGDCAAHENPFGIGLVRLESVQNATDQARCVAQRLTGAPVAYRCLPWFWSHQGAARLQIAGLAMGVDDSVVRGDPTADAFSVFLYRQGRLVAVESVNRPGDHMAARRLITDGVAVPKAVAADPNQDLKALLAPRQAAPAA